MAVESAADLATFFNESEFAEAGVYRVGGSGDGVAVTVVVDRSDREIGLFNSDIISAAGVLYAQVAEIATPADGDTITIDATSEVYTVQGVPKRDATANVWVIEARPS